ncbi:MAG: HIT domain-containing protein [Nanoarchaeota archaeon]|jgi:histidine triad (HIT) family protein|nr:HIT domain-containing protein [Nanoarchaeota archaeon]
MVDCIFCKISKGEIPFYKIYEDENFLAFLDAFPTMRGQVLVVPKKHDRYFFGLDKNDRDSLMDLSTRISKAIDFSLGSSRTGVVIEGIEIDHVHVKLYPLYKIGLRLTPNLVLTSEEMSEIAEKIKGALGD